MRTVRAKVTAAAVTLSAAGIAAALFLAESGHVVASGVGQIFYHT
jgi:hypothetical protein